MMSLVCVAAATAVAAASPGRLCVARHDAATLPPVETFGATFSHAPLVITGSIDAWPALSKWSPHYFASDALPDVTVEVQSGRSGNPEFEADSSKARHKASMGLRAYALLVLNDTTGNDVYLTANNKLLEQPSVRAALLSDMMPAPSFLTELGEVEGVDEEGEGDGEGGAVAARSAVVGAAGGAVEARRANRAVPSSSAASSADGSGGR